MRHDEHDIVYFGITDHHGQEARFGIRNADRLRHIYVIGKTGTGKSTLLENMAIQDIAGGRGMAFIDAHGITAELLLDYVPKERRRDVVYVSPEDREHPISFNVLENVNPEHRHVVVGGLIASFKKAWVDVWSAQVEYVLTNILLALIDSGDATLLEADRMLVDPVYRAHVLARVRDPAVRAFWEQEFAVGVASGEETIALIHSKMGQFADDPLIRNIVGQGRSSVDLVRAMNDGKIILINLAKGRIGKVNAELLGGIFLVLLHLAAIRRAEVTPIEFMALPAFYLFVDEFHSFVSESFADLLADARKYKLSLTVAHQYVEQMPERVYRALMGNVGTVIAFRVGPFDAQNLSAIFEPTFTPHDMVNLGFGQMYLALMIDGAISPPFSARALSLEPQPEYSYRDDIIAHSQQAYGRMREDVERDIRMESVAQPPRPPQEKSPRPVSATTGSARPSVPPVPPHIPVATSGASAAEDETQNTSRLRDAIAAATGGRKGQTASSQHPGELQEDIRKETLVGEISPEELKRLIDE